MSTENKSYLKLNPYLEIISGINAVLTFSEGVIKVIGREGAGKSAVCHLLLEELKEEEIDAVLFSQVPESPEDFSEVLKQKLSLSSKKELVESLSDYIEQQPTHQQKLVLVFDDAHEINDYVFQIISQLAEIKNNSVCLVSIVLCGTEPLGEKLEEPDKKVIQEKVILNLLVHPMDQKEMVDYCNAYMAKVGLNSNTFEQADYERILESSEGYPGKVAELIYELIDEKENLSKPKREKSSADKGLIGKLVELDEDPEPELEGLSVEDKEKVLIDFNDRVPWRWQSNGVAIAVVVLLLIVGYGWFAPGSEPIPTTLPDRVLETIAVVEDEVSPLAAEQVIAVTPSIASEEASVEVVDAAVEAIVNIVEEPVAIAANEIDDARQEVIEEPFVELAVEQEAIVEEAIEQEAAVEEQVEALAEALEEQPLLAVNEMTSPATTEDAQANEESLTGQQLESEEIEQAIAYTQVPVSALTVEPVMVNQATTQSSNQVQRPSFTRQNDPSLQEPLRFINQWTQAWETQNVDQYFQHYKTGFKSVYHQSINDWKADRELKISRPNFIDIEVDGIQLVENNDKELTVQFWLTYVSSYYKDRTLKEIQLLESGNNDFLILQERNIDVEILPYYPR